MNTSDVIRFLCKGQNLSMSELARRIGQTRQNLCKKLDRETLTVEEINQIASVLGGKFDQVFTLPNGMKFNTDIDQDSPKSKTEILTKALWNFNETIQRKATYDSQDINRLLELYRDIFDLDVVYVLEVTADDRSYICNNIALSSEEFDLVRRMNLDMSQKDYTRWIKKYDEDNLCYEAPLTVSDKLKSIMHYGCFRDNKLDGSIGFIDYHKKREWTKEEKQSLLRLGRTLHQIITASRLEKLNREIKLQMDILKTMAEIYLTVHVIDLEEDSSLEISNCDYVSLYTRQHEKASVQIHEAIVNNTTLNEREAILEFARFDNLDERLKDKKTVSIEFRGVHLGWIRAQFIVVERSKQGKLKRVAFTTQVIDAEKRKMAELMHISTTDELTQLNNRRAYEEDIREIEKNGVDKNLFIGAFDVNGLKSANDEIGHEAGDELIRGTAFCITAVFGMVGKLYRTGGDEFMCLMNTNREAIESMKQDFVEIQKNWKGKLIKEISISAGFVCAADFQGWTLHELLSLADQRMYDDKRAYYSRTGKERRCR